MNTQESKNFKSAKFVFLNDMHHNRDLRVQLTMKII